MDLSTGRVTLVEEARELLAGMEAALLEIETEGQTSERINAVFRAAHTIKGSAGLFELKLIEGFTQRLENVLDLVRDAEFGIDTELMSVLLSAKDYIAKLVDAIEAFHEYEDPDAPLRAQLLERLERYKRVKVPARPGAAAQAQEPSKPGLHHVSLSFAASALRDGNCPSAYVDHLRTLGELAYVFTCSDRLPAREAFDPTALYFSFELGLRTACNAAQIEAAFALVRDQITLQILPPGASAAQFGALLRRQPASAERIAALLVQAGALSERDVEASLASGPVTAEPAQIAPPPSAAATAAKKPEERRGAEQRIVKVDADRLDQLINLVGELVIASEGARTTAAGTRREDVLEAMGKVSQLVEQIRDGALNMRMTPIGDVFQRFPRVVRDVSKQLGKKITLEISGADAELDKTMVERLADPLLHIVRNAMDHGIEPVTDRLRVGKPEEGLLRLHAHHESGCIVVEISDDGRGLDPAKLRAKAIDRGLVAADSELSDAECHQLIFAPGFSTAAEVTNLSGRGVGMDVVKRSLELLRGDIEIESRVGRGTLFRMRLPLTLAIIDGFHVEVAGTVFVIPLDMVVECVDMQATEGSQRILNLRDEPLPYLRLRDVFELRRERSKRESLVVVSYGQQRVGLVVDRLLGNSQAVIKPLGEIFRRLHGVSSSTILGDGSVALILDVPTLIAAATGPGAARAGAYEVAASVSP
jgi:two-component system chemotaxis sensor kinase CheA